MANGSAQTVRIEARPNVAPRVRQRFAPAAIQGLEVLALPSARLDTYVASLVEQNPLLEYDYSQAALRFEEFPDENETSDEDGSDASEVQVAGQRLPASLGEHRAFDLERLRDERSETESLHAHLRLQVPAAEFCGSRGKLLDSIIESIDDDGYFTGSLSMLCAEAGCEPDEGEELLQFVQRLSPRGVGARDLSECLMLQLNEDTCYAEKIRAILETGLSDLAENRTTRLLRAYRLTLDDLAAIRETICTLDPRPGASFSQRKDTAYVIPDIVIRRRDSGFAVSVTGELAETVVLNETYCALAADISLDHDTVRWIETKRSEADAVLASISQRKQTLHRFGTYLVEAQYDFFRGGESRIRPLTMQQAADALGVHVSTISRTVQDKYALTPWGVFPLKHFFSTAVACASEERRSALSSLAVKSRIQDLVAHEDLRTPLSDASITAILNGEGIDIKRRTVAKYREALGIGKQSQRRR